MKYAMYCENGHRIAFISAITGERKEALFSSDWGPVRYDTRPLPKFCADCGARTLSKCRDCDTYIEYKEGRGHYMPAYCTECGQAFPWTSERLKEANDYTDELDLSETEKATLKSTYADLTRNTPKTELAIERFKRVSSKVAPQAGSVLKSILIAVADEYTKRKLGW